MRTMSASNLEKLYLAYKEVHQLCDALQIDGVVGDVRINANTAKHHLYDAWQQAIKRYENGE